MCRIMLVKCVIWFVCLFMVNSASAENVVDILNFSTKECFLKEPVYGHKFDFSALNSDFAHIAYSNTGDRFDFNICGSLKRTCDGQSNASACLFKDNKEYVLGTQHELHYRNGKMFFSYLNGTKCPHSATGESYQLHVFIGCDYSLDKNQTVVTPYLREACVFYIILETPFACLPEPENVSGNSCMVKDPETGHVYDLFPLSDANYRLTDHMGSTFIINICKPVLYGENAMCPQGSSVCNVSLQAMDVQYKYSDYGTVQANPVIENGHLLMRLPSNTRCNKTDNYTSIIQFYCEMGVKNAHPELIGIHGCVYEFSFATPLACSNLAPCTAITHGSEILDMRPLKEQQPFTLTMEGKNYTIAICSAAGSPCLENDGSCMRENGQSTSLGVINTNLRFNQSGAPYLLYEGGANCQNLNDDGHASLDRSVVGNGSATSTTSWSTRIEFVCANNSNNDNNTSSSSSSVSASTIAKNVAGPKIIENSNCQLLIHYQTELACQEQITCKAKVYVEHSEDGTGVELVDLAPLISTAENYEAQVDNSLIETGKVPKETKFFLNVCRPLVSKYGLGCPGGSAACMATMNANSRTPQAEKSMGYPLVSLVAINRTTAELRYLKGGNCPTDQSVQMSTGITFYCDMRAGRGLPILHAINDCHYEFLWATNVLCPRHRCVFDSNTCEIVNDDINAKFNFKQASFTDAEGRFKVQLADNEITVNVCGANRKPFTDYSQHLVNLYFTMDGPCKSNGIVNVQMRLVCSNETGIASTFIDPPFFYYVHWEPLKCKGSSGHTLFSKDRQCNLIYVLNTPEICEFLGLSVKKVVTTTATPTQLNFEHTTLQSKHAEQEQEHEAEHVASIGVVLLVILSLAFFSVCLAMLLFSPARRQAVRYLFRRSSSAVRYSRVRSNEEANLLLETNEQFTDTDDDMLL